MRYLTSDALALNAAGSQKVTLGAGAVILAGETREAVASVVAEGAGAQAAEVITAALGVGALVVAIGWRRVLVGAHRPAVGCDLLSRKTGDDGCRSGEMHTELRDVDCRSVLG